MKPFEIFLNELGSAGLWSDLASDQEQALIQALSSGGDVTWFAGGVWRADGEDLADGDVETWLRHMMRPLKDCGIDLRIDTVSGPFDEGSVGYSVAVNGKVLCPYTFTPTEPGLPASEDPWMDCTVLPAAEVNALLRSAGSSRRVALFGPGGNDGFAVLGEESVLRRIDGAPRPWHHVVIP